MPYAHAVTPIDEIPMIQLPSLQRGQGQFSEIPRGREPRGSFPRSQPQFDEVQYDNEITAFPAKQPNGRPFEGNPYYEEIIKEHPGIQSKIRNTDPNPYGKYEETVPKPEPPAQISWNNIPEYPIISTPPGAVRQNYMPSSMHPRAQAQHLPVAPHISSHYERPLVDSALSSYPVVENFLSCRDVMNHVNSCPICSHLYHKNDRVWMGVVSLLVLLIFVLIFRFSKRP
jgi:hypothetical protein